MTTDEKQAAERFGENLRLLRATRRLTQENLSFPAGVHRTQFSLIENGQRQPMLLTYLKICGALELSPEVLVRGIAWQSVGFGGSFSIEDRREWKP